MIAGIELDLPLPCWIDADVNSDCEISTAFTRYPPRALPDPLGPRPKRKADGVWLDLDLQFYLARLSVVESIRMRDLTREQAAGQS